MDAIINEIRERIKANSRDEYDGNDEYENGKAVGLAIALRIIDEVEKEHPAKVGAIGNSGNETIAIIVDRDDCKILPGGGLDERLVAELEAAAEQLSRRREEAIAIENIELPEIKPSVDDIARKEAKERRQQFKYALRYSNRRK